jgi:hypothetical protein
MLGGPRWFKGARYGDVQADANGTRWEVVLIQEGGRVLHWFANGRKARTEAAPSHPDYPSDAELEVAAKAKAKALREARRRYA